MMWCNFRQMRDNYFYCLISSLIEQEAKEWYSNAV